MEVFQAISQFLLVIMLTVCTTWYTFKLSRKGAKWLVFCYIPAITAIAYVVLSCYFRWLAFIQPFNWLLSGRIRFVVLVLGGAAMFGALMTRLPRLQTRILLIIFMMIFCSYSVGACFLYPVFLHEKLLNDPPKPQFEQNVCLQSTAFTCGPAAAVTFLKTRGIEANERELAVLAYTTPQFGTTEETLVDAINKAHGPEGVNCHYVYVDTIEELKDHCPAIAVIKYSLLADHFITVLDVDNEQLTLGDPAQGRVTMTHDEFLNIWRRAAIVFK